MPRYHFHILDGKADADQHGMELPDIDAAKQQAVKLAGEVVRESTPSAIWAVNWRLLVNDSPSPESGSTHFSLELAAKDGS